jgi:NAD(P)-dependent dehydrogenase (short-subunit alcohol dehydrogenase family)
VDSLEIAVVGDATDPGQVRALSHSLMMETNGLDLLIVSATGTLDSLWLDAEHEKRIWSYLEHELRLLLVPLTHLASAMRQGGLCAFVSSEALGLAEGGGLGPECSEWPHYVAAKAAGEALMRVAALEYPWLTFVVARLPALDTQLASRTAIAPGESADLIAGELIDAWSRGYPSRFDIAWLGSDQELP